jgi:hypothetical protein
MSERPQHPDESHEPDERSDPAHHPDGNPDGNPDDQGSDDWSSEGGAVPEGPATHPADADPEDTPT